jgi:pantoate--beta-alanine ligase
VSAPDGIERALDIARLRQRVSAWRSAGLRVGFVPTMGNLHAGHLALIDIARQHADRVVASVFVNPTQFAPGEDYARYPRSLEADAAALSARGCDLLFAPAVEEMYPEGTHGLVEVRVPGLEDLLCGAFRPGHFRGVATVVAKLFGQVRPDVAVFGAKDWQQLLVVRAMVIGLDFGIEIIAGPTLREPDGLAMSSRNQYLSAEDRQKAPVIHRTLRAMAAAVRQGASIPEAESAARIALEAEGFVVDYVAVRAGDDLGMPVPGQARVALAAARLGNTRLIDNISVDQ